MRRPAAKPSAEPFRYYRPLDPHGAPDAPDGSTPKFAVCGRHLKAVDLASRGRGFPVLALASRPARRRPPWS